MRVSCLAFVLTAGALSAASAVRCFQEVPPPPQQSVRPQQPAGKKPRKQIHANDFLIRGTVFHPQGMSFAGAELRIRRAGEKKFRWQALSDRRGEFAVWIPAGSDYELSVRARGFEEQTRAVAAKSGVHQEDMVFRMQPASGGKTK